MLSRADTRPLQKSLGDRVQLLHIKDGWVAGDTANSLPRSGSVLDVRDALAAAFKNQTPAGQGDVDVPTLLTVAPHALPEVPAAAFH